MATSISKSRFLVYGKYVDGSPVLVSPMPWPCSSQEWVRLFDLACTADMLEIGLSMFIGGGESQGESQGESWDVILDDGPEPRLTLSEKKFTTDTLIDAFIATLPDKKRSVMEQAITYLRDTDGKNLQSHARQLSHLLTCIEDKLSSHDHTNLHFELFLKGRHAAEFCRLLRTSWWELVKEHRGA